ncbi:LuxR C-terminal-related transcriptional regulator [Mycobacterium sp. MYCO198283]|uniref:helix-turn-helix transcriptional regulator n=1 Tax=Mycobacterium sp. MYCO198283 TaxID=2883505 RepID=UPI001E2F4413|nr:LuxR family transcriptional regulator [Mycobacterium sp. MYCO198283]MCG5433354.1 LuxR C-terminal-related transcriptional regulator [Mycobacterium sp. MYCO198283]
MGVRWITARREDTREHLARALSPRRRGAVLVGAAGVGKTVMSRGVAKELLTRHPEVSSHWISGTASAQRVPFGAFSHLVDVSGDDEPAALLRRARETLCRSAPHGLLLVVDDAHHLDVLSATLVHQLGVTGAARLLLTVRDGETPPDAVTALWKDRILERIDLQPFTPEETAALLRTVLGGAVESVTTGRMVAVSQGNPLYLRHLVEASVASGALRQVDDIWQLRGEFSLTPQLSSLIDLRLAGMPPAGRGVLEFLAVEEPLAVGDLADLVGIDAVEQAEATGLITVTERSGHLVAHPIHPLYTERVRTSMGRLARRRLSKLLVSQLSSHPAPTLTERLRVAALAINTDTPPDAQELITLSWEAMRMGDLTLGERLARAALRQSPTLQAKLPLSHALSWQGRGAEADEALTGVDPDTLSPWELMAWTLPKAANMFWMLGDSAPAVAFLQEMRARITEPAALHTIDALAATFAMNTGDPSAAVSVAAEVLAAPDALDLAVAWAAATATLSTARMGRFDEVDALAARGLAAAHPGLLRFTIGLGQTLTLVMAGDVAGAERLARHYLGFSEFQQPGRAIGEVLLAQVVMVRGGCDEAVSLLRQAGAALTSTGYSWGPLALICLAQVLGQQGKATDAAAAVERAERAHAMRSEIYAPDLALARAWSRAAARDIRGAIGAARDARRIAEASGQHAIALRAVHDAVRFGDTAASDDARRIARQLTCRFAPLVVEHARALGRGDGPALDRIAAELQSMGMVAAAADAAAQAATAHAGRHERAGELAARATAASLANRCGNPLTPALEAVLSPLPLTGREREIAVMVSQGLSNKAIAEQLCVSVRTVEGHVYRACQKLDVPDRSALATAVAAITG